MIFEELSLPGAFVIKQELRCDERGTFARNFCRNEFARNGIQMEIAQSSHSFTARQGTIRGLHYQATPHEEAKLVTCLKGAAFDVLVDLRPKSATRWQWLGTEIRAGEGRSIYIPRGMAHGFQTLADGTELLYQISTPYEPAAARGIRWDDPKLAIKWPCGYPSVISDRDLALPVLLD